MIMRQLCVWIVAPVVLYMELNVTELDTHTREREKVKPGETQIKPIRELIALCPCNFPRFEGITAKAG